MAITSRDRKSLIRLAAREALSTTGQMAYLETQRNVPVITGFLKNSGSIAEDMESVIIRYSAEYASFIERGWAGGMVWTDPHVRLGTIRVKGHYKNQPPREAQNYIRNSLNKYFKDLYLSNRTYFQDAFYANLQKYFPGKSIREI